MNEQAGEVTVNCIFLQGHPSIQSNKHSFILYYMPRTSSGVRLLNYSSHSGWEKYKWISSYVTMWFALQYNYIQAVMGEEKRLVPELHEGAVPKLDQKGSGGLASPGNQGQDFQGNTETGKQIRSLGKPRRFECSWSAGWGSWARRGDWKGSWVSLWIIVCTLRTSEFIFQEMGNHHRVLKRTKMWSYLYFRKIALETFT